MSLTGLFKPPAHSPEKQNNDKEPTIDKKRRSLLIYLSHIIFIVPVLLYIAIYKRKVNPIIYPLLGFLSIFTLGYHGFSIMMQNK